MRKVLTVLTFLSINSMAEYRAYQYYIRPKVDKNQEVKAYLVTSALDPVSYNSYYGGSTSIEVDLLRTWICPGDTSRHKEICRSPYKKYLDALKKQTSENGQ